jgi:hypothetical protein
MTFRVATTRPEDIVSLYAKRQELYKEKEKNQSESMRFLEKCHKMINVVPNRTKTYGHKCSLEICNPMNEFQLIKKNVVPSNYFENYSWTDKCKTDPSIYVCRYGTMHFCTKNVPVEWYASPDSGIPFSRCDFSCSAQTGEICCKISGNSIAYKQAVPFVSQNTWKNLNDGSSGFSSKENPTKDTTYSRSSNNDGVNRNVAKGNNADTKKRSSTLEYSGKESSRKRQKMTSTSSINDHSRLSYYQTTENGKDGTFSNDQAIDEDLTVYDKTARWMKNKGLRADTTNVVSTDKNDIVNDSVKRKFIRPERSRNKLDIDIDIDSEITMKRKDRGLASLNENGEVETERSCKEPFRPRVYNHRFKGYTGLNKSGRTKRNKKKSANASVPQKSCLPQAHRRQRHQQQQLPQQQEQQQQQQQLMHEKLTTKFVKKLKRESINMNLIKQKENDGNTKNCSKRKRYASEIYDALNDVSERPFKKNKIETAGLHILASSDRSSKTTIGDAMTTRVFERRHSCVTETMVENPSSGIYSEEESKIRRIAKALIMDLFYSEKRTEIYIKSTKGPRDRGERAVKAKWEKAIKEYKKFKTKPKKKRRTVTVDIKPLIRGSISSSQNGIKLIPVYSIKTKPESDVYEGFNSMLGFTTYRDTVMKYTKIKKTPQLIIDERFIAFFVELAVTHWYIIKESPYGRCFSKNATENKRVIPGDVTLTTYGSKDASQIQKRRDVSNSSFSSKTKNTTSSSLSSPSSSNKTCDEIVTESLRESYTQKNRISKKTTKTTKKTATNTKSKTPMSFLGLCLALLYTMRVKDTKIKDRVIIPYCKYVAENAPQIKDLEEFDSRYQCKLITRSTDELKAAYRLMVGKLAVRKEDLDKLENIKY